MRGRTQGRLAGVPAQDAGQSFKDERIKAFYIMGSGPGQGFMPDSLKSISAPFVVDTAQFDEVLDPVSNSSNLARQIPGAREVVRAVGHFAYVPECRWLVGPILTRLAGLPLCDDPQRGESRARAQCGGTRSRDVLRKDFGASRAALLVRLDCDRRMRQSRGSADREQFRPS